jgi:hypothetical protein
MHPNNTLIGFVMQVDLDVSPFTECKLKRSVLSRNGSLTRTKTSINSDETSERGIPKEQRLTFKISTFKQFSFSKVAKGKVVTRQFIGGLTSSTFTLQKSKVSPQLPLEKAYPAGKVTINKKKLNDIDKLMDYICIYVAKRTSMTTLCSGQQQMLNV